ncbi:MAG: nitric-oxide reductase large subunit [Parvibaculum sp.]|nr:nitric-oxide reductase large subunit [Parvibaculum sp.]
MRGFRETFSVKRLWIFLALGMTIMFGALLAIGWEIYQEAPPIPTTVQTPGGDILYTAENIRTGQQVWQSLGGMQQGSIWGHGSYLAPDWSADWLQREATALLAIMAEKNQFTEQPPEDRTPLQKAALVIEMRKNTYDSATGVITVSEERARAIREVEAHFTNLYAGQDAPSLELRKAYAFPARTFLTPERGHDLAAFYFWTAWAATTNRPDNTVTYTSNWPHEPLVENRPTAGIFMWSIFSIVILLVGIGTIVWYYAKQYDQWRDEMEPEGGVAATDIMDISVITPSMRATAKYFWLVSALFCVQVLLGILTAHYAVEGQGVYGLPLVEYFPYTVTRSWHTQLSVLWIATAWLATGLYVAPLLTKRDPKFQVFGVNFLFISLLVIVVGGFIGQWAAVNGFISNLTTNYWFGHQGWEYVDLGRFWQIYLTIGLFLWVTLVLRGVWPALHNDNSRSILFLIMISVISIGLLYAAGLMWGERPHLVVAEYWRWWIVHLWVEGIFEVFATAIISVLFVHMGLVRVSTATVMVLFATIIFLFGGVLGTFHHMYFTGTPISVIAAGASLSALEVVPLLVVGFEAYNHKRIEGEATWTSNYHWPFMFFSAVLFWNFVGAGVFGFLINPPLALYYMQGLNTTANHGHAALFGVYGMLGLGLTLYCVRGLTDVTRWNNKLLKISFWSLNIGLAMMTFLSLFPQGMWQTYASVNVSYAYARSAEFVQSPIMHTLVWMRVPGDIVFSVGVGAFALFMLQAFLAKNPARRN